MPDTGRHPASADGCVGSFLPQMSEQELLRTALVLPPRARRVLCVWAAVPGLVCAPFAFWQSVWAGAVFLRCMGGAGGACPGALLQLCRRPDDRQRHGTVRGWLSLCCTASRAGRSPGCSCCAPHCCGRQGCTVLLVRSPGLQLVLPGIPAAQATALAAVLMEGNV